MTDYQKNANKAIQPIRYQGFIPNSDNAVLDLISGRSFLENIGVMKPKAEGNFYLPQWKKPEQEVVYDPSKAPKKEKPKPQSKPKPSVKPESKKEQPKVEQPVKKTEQPKPIERKQNVYEGSPVYSPGVGSGLRSALIGFANQKGDTTYIKPEDYDRFAVPKYAKEYIESKKKQRNGGVNKADEYPIEKLDQSLNFTNYNKPTKGGWLDKYK